MKGLSLQAVNRAIQNSGLKKTYIAQKLGMQVNTLYCKLIGRRPFTNSELSVKADVTGAEMVDFFLLGDENDAA
jgi:hypothetical protein